MITESEESELKDYEIREYSSQELMELLANEKLLSNPITSENWKIHKNNYDKILKEIKNRNRKK